MAIKRVYNLKKDSYDARDYQFMSRHLNVFLPENVDNRHYFSEVRDQGDLGSCTAFSTVCGAYEMLHIKQLLNSYPINESPDLNNIQTSPLFQYQNALILENSFGTDNGAEIRTAIKAMNKFGVCKIGRAHV